MNDPIAEKVREIIGHHANVDPASLCETMDLEKDLSCDSIDIMEISMTMEEAFGIEIPDDAGETIKTVGDAVARARELTTKAVSAKPL